mgnify:CR=1 FL=1
MQDNGPLLIDMMTQSTARHANSALQSMQDQVREELEASSSLQDFEDRLSALDLDSDAFAKAMTDAVLVMELAGQAEVLEQIRGG